MRCRADGGRDNVPDRAGLTSRGTALSSDPGGYDLMVWKGLSLYLDAAAHAGLAGPGADAGSIGKREHADDIFRTGLLNKQAMEDFTSHRSLRSRCGPCLSTQARYLGGVLMDSGNIKRNEMKRQRNLL